jgi:hypothetical protein
MTPPCGGEYVQLLLNYQLYHPVYVNYCTRINYLGNRGIVCKAVYAECGCESKCIRLCRSGEYEFCQLCLASEPLTSP